MKEVTVNTETKELTFIEDDGKVNVKEYDTVQTQTLPETVVKAYFDAEGKPLWVFSEAVTVQTLKQQYAALATAQDRMDFIERRLGLK